MAKNNFIDRAITYLSPKAGCKRAGYRAVLDELQKRRYEAASVSRRTKGWVALDSGPNSEISPALSNLRARSRDLVRNNPHANRAVGAISSNIVGAGIIPGQAPNGAGNQKASDVWKAWGDTLECDADGLCNFYGLQDIVVRELAEAGEVIIRRRHRRAKDGLTIPLQLQVLEADHLADEYACKSWGSNKVRMGVEFDPRGRRVAYHLYKEHPGDSILGGMRGDAIRVPAEDIIHLFRVDRAGQVRGIPWGAPVLLKLRDYDDYDDAQLMRQKIAACFAAFVTNDLEGSASTTGKGLDEKIEPATIHELPPGRSVEFAKPPTVGSEFESYSKVTLRAVAAGFGIPYEVLTKDLSGTNYSSYRAGHIEFERDVEKWQWNLVIPRLCEPVWKWFIEAADLAGHLSAGSVDKASWTPPARRMIDPTKEIPAEIKAIRGGVKTLSEVVRARGRDPDVHLKEIKSDNDMIDKHGLVLDSDPRKMDASGKAHANSEDKDDDEKNEE